MFQAAQLFPGGNIPKGDTIAVCRGQYLPIR